MAQCLPRRGPMLPSFQNILTFLPSFGSWVAFLFVLYLWLVVVDRVIARQLGLNISWGLAVGNFKPHYHYTYLSPSLKTPSRASVHLQYDSFSSHTIPPLSEVMSLTPVMFRSLMRLVLSLVDRPAASVTTMLYYSDLLPRDLNLERLVQHDLLHRENYLFHFLINLLRMGPAFFMQTYR